MIKKLKYKFLATIMIFVTIIIVAFVSAVTFIPARQNDHQAEIFLRMMAETAEAPSDSELSPEEPETAAGPEGGSETATPFPQGNNPDLRPNPGNDNSPFNFANLISAVLDEDGNVISWFSDRSDLYDEEYIEEAAAELFQSDKEFGKFDGQYYLLLKHDQSESADKPAEIRNEPAGKAGNATLEKENAIAESTDKTPPVKENAITESSNNSSTENNSEGTSEAGATLILLDNSLGFASAKHSLILGAGAGIIAWFLLLFLAVFLVNRMTRPVSEAFEKQRRFIADAGHELKTPISVISANAGVLKSEIGENKWLSYINNETHRMELLVKELMSLAAIDDGGNAAVSADYDLSSAVLTAALPFESLAFEKGQSMEFDVADGIYTHGSQAYGEQLVTILLSNAVKYGKSGGIIRLSLTQERKKAVLKVYNTGEGISPADKEKIFDRFYRADKARSREQNSFGLGLAIAKAITKEQNAHISVDSKYGQWVEFTVIFPLGHQK